MKSVMLSLKLLLLLFNFLFSLFGLSTKSTRQESLLDHGSSHLQFSVPGPKSRVTKRTFNFSIGHWSVQSALLGPCYSLYGHSSCQLFHVYNIQPSACDLHQPWRLNVYLACSFSAFSFFFKASLSSFCSWVNLVPRFLQSTKPYG